MQTAQEFGRPLAIRGVSYINPDDIGVLPELQFREGHTTENGLEPAEELAPPEPYDVDRGGILLVWVREGVMTRLAVDGHHRLAIAKKAPLFYSTNIIKGVKTPVERLLPCRELWESDGWTLEGARALGIVANQGEAAVDSRLAADSVNEGETVEVDTVVGDSAEWLAGDAAAGTLGRVRQLAAIADYCNSNSRFYPSAVIASAVADANAFAQPGAMLSEREHPKIVNVCDRNRCGDMFVTDPALVTARIDAFDGPDKHGRVFVTRTILDTPEGRKIKAALDAGQPVGLSIRVKMRGAYDSARKAFVATWMQIVGVDDVRTPAVAGAGAVADSACNCDGDCKCHSAADAMRTELGQMETIPTPQGDDGLGPPSADFPVNTVNPEGSEVPPAVASLLEAANASDDTTHRLDGAETPKKTMDKTQIMAATREFSNLVRKGGGPQITEAEKAAGDAILEGYKAGIDVRDVVGTFLSAHAYGDGREIPGFNPGKTGVYVELATELGGDPSSGWAPEIVQGKGDQERLLAQNTKVVVPSDGPPPQTTAKADSEAKEAAFADAVKEAAHPFHRLSADVQSQLRGHVLAHSDSLGDVTTMLDDAIELASKAAADSKLAAIGGRRGNTVGDPAHPARAEVTTEANPTAAHFERIMAAADDVIMSDTTGRFKDLGNPNAPEIKAMRARNREKAKSAIEQSIGKMIGGRSVALVGGDSTEEGFFKGLQDVITAGDSIAGSTSNFLNQPVVLSYLITQGYQDLRMLDFVQPFGPGQEVSESMGMPGWENSAGLGSVFKVPLESITDAANQGWQYGAIDGGLTFAEGAGIDEMTTNIYWDTFFPNMRKVATSATYEAIRQMGNGPLNYPLIARALLAISARKSRTIDTALANEIPNIAFEYGAVAVSAEAYTTGNSKLPNNSVLPASGAVTVNLNPAKTAVAAVAATDKSVTYGTGGTVNGVTGLAPISAIRLIAGTPGSINGTTIYYSNNLYGPTPIVLPRTTKSLNNAGAQSTSTLNPITVSAPASMVAGVLGPDGNIYPVPGSGTTPTYAIDYINGVLLFASGVSGSAGVQTTATTITYSYATNWDYFVVSSNMVSLPSGTTLQAYYNGLLGQLDTTAGVMGSYPRFQRPDLGLMSLNVSAKVSQATIFYQLNNPKGTELYPNEVEFARRNGIGLARLNTPWWIGDNAIILTRYNSTKYAVDTPFMTEGPFAKYDSSGRLQAGQAYYGYENSAIFTPQAKDINGNILNPVARAVVLY